MIFSLTLIILYHLTKASHFRGGSISWKPLQDLNTSVLVQFNAFWSWRLSAFNSPGTGSLVITGGSIDCRIGCQGSIGDTNFFETSKSVFQDWISGEKKWSVSVPKKSLVRASFSSCCWISLNPGGSNWEIGVMLNTQVRNDTGKINSSPVSIMPSILTIDFGSSSSYKIPITDDDNDTIKCRWSDNSLNEYGDICGPSALVDLDFKKCEFIINSTRGTYGWYGVSITIDDFAHENSTNPLSSVVVQFLIRVKASSGGCTLKPLITDKKNQTIINAYTTRQLKIPLEIQIGCPGSRILEVQLIGPTNMTYQNLTSVNNSIYATSIIWTPTFNQIGKHLVNIRVIDIYDFESNFISYEITVNEFIYNTLEWYTVDCILTKSRTLKNGTVEVISKEVSLNHLCDILDSHRSFNSLPLIHTAKEFKLGFIDTIIKRVDSYIKAYNDNKFFHFISASIAVSIICLFWLMIIINDCLIIFKKLCYCRRNKKVAPLN